MNFKARKKRESKNKLISNLIFIGIASLLAGVPLIHYIIDYRPNLNELIHDILPVMLLLLWLSVMFVLPIYGSSILYHIGVIFRELELKKVQKVNDIAYYRDVLDGISPLLISYMDNTRIENKKDISAYLLKMYRQERINIVDYEVKRKKGISYTDEEKLILELVTFPTQKGFSELKKLLLKKAENKKYFKEKINTKRLVGQIDEWLNESNLEKWGWAIFFGSILIIYAVLLLVSNEAVRIAIFSENGLATIMLLGVLLVLILVGYYDSGGNLKFTEKGKELREKILGLKKFISDFSLLSKREKEQVVLWEDFLVYSVVFGQNKKIVKDILKYYNIPENVQLIGDINV